MTITFFDRWKAALLAVASALLFVGPSVGQQNALVFPWQAHDYQGYDEPRYVEQPLDFNATPATPVKYEFSITTMPDINAENPNIAKIVAHVPENAAIWFDGNPTTSTGKLRTFRSPALDRGRPYSYTVRIDWIEDGKQVSQTHVFPVKAAGIYGLYLVKAGAGFDPEKAAVAQNLAKLSVEDRKAALSQKYCAVQKAVPLGATGVPVKIDIKGQSVWLCCDACTDRALANPDKTLARVKELKAKSAPPPAK